MLGYADFVKLVIEALEVAGIDYLIGGAVAAWAWGEPRSTLDLNLVVDIPVESVNLLSQELAKRDIPVPADIILDAIIEDRFNLPINAIHMYSGLKADLYPLHPQDELRRSALERRRQVDFGPSIGRVYIHSPEDLIVYKVLYFSIYQQTKHLRDIAAILKSVGDEIDYAYIETWVERKGLGSIWREILWNIQTNF
jgi:hypothetical protein